VVGAQLPVRGAAGPRPAHPHVPRRQRLELKVPAALGDGVALVRAEHAASLAAGQRAAGLR